MSRFVVEYLYAEIYTMHIVNVYGLNCVCNI
jgi:hypothetical protein